VSKVPDAIKVLGQVKVDEKMLRIWTTGWLL
jgi:hypothetical protein